MPRPGVTPQFAAAIAQPVIRPFLLYSLKFKSDILYLWSGHNTLTWGGIDWVGSGSLLSVEGIGENSEVKADTATLTLSGVPSSILSHALTDVQRGLPAQIYLGLFDDNGTIVPDPVLAYSGRIDQPKFKDGGETCTISLTIKNPLADMNRPVDRRWTDVDQQMDHPGDLGCAFVNSIQHFRSFFGQLSSSINTN